MNKRYINLIMASIPAILVCGMVISSVNVQESGGQKDEIDEEQITQTENTADEEIKLTAGFAEILEEIELEDAGIQARSIDDTEESEYSNFAIANVTNYVNVRSTPDTNGEIVGKMYDNSVAQILSVVGEGDDEWFQVISGSVEGYIKSEYFIYGDEAAAVIDDYVTKYVVVKADRLNVREEPDIHAKRIGYMDNGEKGKLLEFGEDWMKVLYAEGKEGYVATPYVVIEEEFVYAKSI